MSHYIILFFLLIIDGIVLISSVKPPEEFVLCHRSDPDFGNCLARAVQNSIRAIAAGNKELDVPILDHIKVSNIIIKGNGGPVDLTQHYTNCIITGPIDSTYTYAEVAFEHNKCYIHLKSILNTLTMACQYVFKGKVLLLQLNSHGYSKTTVQNINAWHNLTCNIYEKGGNEYLNITDWTEEYAVGNILYDFENLVDGNAEMSAQVLQVLNDNALEVFENVRIDYEKVFAAIYKPMAYNVFRKIPWKDIFLQ